MRNATAYFKFHLAELIRMREAGYPECWILCVQSNLRVSAAAILAGDNYI